MIFRKSLAKTTTISTDEKYGGTSSQRISKVFHISDVYRDKDVRETQTKEVATKDERTNSKLQLIEDFINCALFAEINRPELCQN